VEKLQEEAKEHERNVVEAKAIVSSAVVLKRRVRLCILPIGEQGFGEEKKSHIRQRYYEKLGQKNKMAKKGDLREYLQCTTNR
jgi:hypothetical protein